MNTMRLILTAEEAIVYALLTTYKDQTEFVQERIPDYIACGYGYYGLVSGRLEAGEITVYDNDEKKWTTTIRYYVRYLCGKSCD